MSVIDLQDIEFQYVGAQSPTLHISSLKIEKEERIFLYGPSGSGKSTMMNVLGCLDRPTGGRYYLDGIDVSNLSRNQFADIRNRKIGFVFQNFNLLARTSALDNVKMPMLYNHSGSMLTSKQQHDKAMKMLDMVGISKRADHTPSQLSGGQQQRVAIARALVNDPVLLLADEPTGNLDTRTSCEILGIFQRLNQEGITVLMVTHENDIANFAKRIIIMRDGRVRSDEPVLKRSNAEAELKKLEAEKADDDA